MGNVFLVDQTDARSAMAARTFKGSDAAILQTEVAAFIASLIAQSPGPGLYDVNIAGAGDGEYFIVTVLTSTGLPEPGAGTTVSFFQASSYSELGVKMNAAFAALATGGKTLRGVGMDGTALGNHYMGFFLYS